MNSNGKPLAGCYLHHVFTMTYPAKTSDRAHKIECIEKWITKDIVNHLILTCKPYFVWPQRNIYAGTPDEAHERPIYEDIKTSKCKYLHVYSGLSAKTILDFIKVALLKHKDYIKVDIGWNYSCQSVDSKYGIDFNDNVTIEQSALSNL